jgi:hypothetical protein
MFSAELPTIGHIFARVTCQSRLQKAKTPGQANVFFQTANDRKYDLNQAYDETDDVAEAARALITAVIHVELSVFFRRDDFRFFRRVGSPA